MVPVHAATLEKPSPWHLFTHLLNKYRIRGLFGDDFNLAVWQITSESPNLSHAILKAIF